MIKKKRKHMRTADKRHDWANRKWGISYNNYMVRKRTENSAVERKSGPVSGVGVRGDAAADARRYRHSLFPAVC